MDDWITTSMIPYVFVYVRLCMQVCIKALYVCALWYNGTITASSLLSGAPAFHESYIFFMHFSFIPLSLSRASLSTLHADEDGRLPHYGNKFIFCAYHGAELISVLTTFFPKRQLISVNN